MKTILVTGGSGLVGQGLQFVVKNERCCKDENWVFLSSKDGDLRCSEDTRKIFEKHQPTHVIHLAAQVGGLFKNMKSKLTMCRDNILLNDNVLHFAHVFRVSKLLSCMTTCAFPDKISYPIDETMMHLGPPHFSNEGYAYAKRMLDVYNRLYHDEFGMQFTSLILTNVFGPYDNYNMEDGHVIPGLIHRCHQAKMNNEPFVVWGSGKPLRQFVYSLDVGRLFSWALDHYEEIDPILIAGDEKDEISIGKAAELIACAMDYEGHILFDSTKADGQFKKTVTNAKLKRLNPDFCFTNFEEGLLVL
eukprot:GCRY01003706.1.p1 GENE.GCRY01003706.1~~GCRY01003706.1.p1  ORF type:complete len:303 (-),score=10.12 GCRY01003706.1:504-1412(-)